MASDLGASAGEVHGQAREVLRFWLEELKPEDWFAKSNALDGEIARRFEPLRQAVLASGAAGNNISANDIAWNGGDGISLPDAGPQNLISENSMHDNGGLGIDLGGNGTNANDNDAIVPAGSPNRLLNFPVIASAGGNAHAGTIRGYLQSTNGHYTLEFYADDTADPSLHGEGRTYLGSGELDITNAPAGQNGSNAFAIAIGSDAGLLGKSISAIGRDAIGNTSEFSLRSVYAFEDAIFANGFDPFTP